MILKIVIIAVIVCIVATIINGIEDYNKDKAMIEMSFRDTMGKLKLPIVSLVNNNKTFNFLIDTGSTYSLIDTIALDKISHSKVSGVKGTAYGVDGEIVPIEYTNITLSHNGKEFEDEFQIMRVGAFDNLRENNGMDLVGILGTTFLEKYNFMIDFKNLIIYTETDGNN